MVLLRVSPRIQLHCHLALSLIQQFLQTSLTQWLSSFRMLLPPFPSFLLSSVATHSLILGLSGNWLGTPAPTTSPIPKTRVGILPKCSYGNPGCSLLWCATTLVPKSLTRPSRGEGLCLFSTTWLLQGLRTLG